MKTLLLFCSIVLAQIGLSQTILHPSGSGHSTVKIAPGKTYQYFDDGGASGKYGYGTSSLLTFLPAKEGYYIQISCESITLGKDCRMYFFDGNHASAPNIGYYQSLPKYNNLKIGSGAVRTASSTNESGAITVRFTHGKYQPTQDGWKFTVRAVKQAGSNPPPTTQDCAGAIKVCSDSAITTKSIGCGYQELPGPGLWNTILNYGNDGENQSNWYKFEVATGGTILFLIKPHRHTDFDWALWGPYQDHQCVAWTTDKPLRLSAGDGKNSTTGITGLAKNARDLYEDSPGDGFLAPLQVQAGQHYALMIDDWSGNNTTFDLEWTFLNGASLECAADEEPEVDLDTIQTVEIIDDPCITPLEVKATATEANTEILGAITTQVTGGTAPYQYQWKDNTGAQLSTLPVVADLVAGMYTLELVDAAGCALSLDIEVPKGEEIPVEIDEEPKLEADISPDQTFVTVSYPGAFEYKIENENGETVITGHAVNSDEVEITRLPKGKYRVSLIYKKIKQYDTFTKK